ncbi:hypothetical protein KP509_36G042900 [Ceratopteris richardii]|uniref:Uncharacterized protein n=1 Tax=Ceratopteris richardii TaxID=49495 RepID=A0A8T2QD12_CERRI|nr:hypothetical protein KP509_36G042900 [Ceratopteris richardii]
MHDKINHTVRYGLSEKEALVSAYGECGRKFSCSPAGEQYNLVFSYGAALSKPSVALEGLHRISIRDLVVGHRHRGQVLYGSLCVQPLIILAVHTILEDDKGDAIRLCVYNATGDAISEQHLEFVFSKGVKVAIKEPYFTVDEDGTLAIRVDNPSDVVRNPPETEADMRGLISCSPACGLRISDAQNIRKQGNQAFRSENWDQAVRLYTEAAKVLLPFGYKPLLQPSYLRDGIREELLIVFSNRAEARLLLRHYEAAEIDARVALQLQSDHRKSLSRRGRALHGLHRYKEANHCFQKALTVIARDGNLETEKGLLRKLIEESSICEQQRTTGVYNLVELLKDAKSGKNPVCGEYVGPVIIGAAKDANMGRAILVNRDVEPGELLIVSKAIAHAKINPFDFSSPLDESGSVRERESMWKTLHDPIVSQVLGRARSSEVFQKQVFHILIEESFAFIRILSDRGMA